MPARSTYARESPTVAMIRRSPTTPAADSVVPMPRSPGSRRAIAWTSWLATRTARRSRRANTSGSRVAGVPFISRHITCAASSEAISPPSTPPMPSHTTMSGPRTLLTVHGSVTSTGSLSSRLATRKWSSLCSRTEPTSLAPTTTTSTDLAVGTGSLMSPPELDAQELIAHADVVAVLERRRSGHPDERAVGAAQIGDLRALAVPRHRRVAPRHERVVAEHDVALLAAEHDLVADEVANVAIAARRDELDQPAPRLARRRAEQRDAVADQRLELDLVGVDPLVAQHLA